MQKLDKAKPGVCFLVLAHHQPKVFHKLIDVLAAEAVDIVVHIDKRTNLADFERSEPNVDFVTPRRRVHWAGWSQAKALLATMRHALSRSNADYFVFVAGTDFPIKHPRLFVEHLASVYPSNFLNHYPLVPGIWGYGLCARYHFVDLKAKIFDTRYLPLAEVPPFKKRCIAALDASQKKINAYLSPRPIKKFKFYHGSSRWCLNRETVSYVVDYFYSGRSRKLRRFLRFSTSSDEIFIQTAVLNSSFRHQCNSYDEEEHLQIFEGRKKPFSDEIRVYFHYIDWSTERENPAILDDSDLVALVKSDKYFASKFMDDRSIGLINSLKQNFLDSDASR